MEAKSESAGLLPPSPSRDGANPPRRAHQAHPRAHLRADSKARRDQADVSALDGAVIPWVFASLRAVCKTFHALALPIAIRHLRVQHCKLVIPILEKYDVGHKVWSLVLDDTVTAEEGWRLLFTCTQLQTLQLYQLHAPIPRLHSTVTALYLHSFSDLDCYALSVLAATLPNVEKLALLGDGGPHSHPLPILRHGSSRS